MDKGFSKFLWKLKKLFLYLILKTITLKTNIMKKSIFFLLSVVGLTSVNAQVVVYTDCDYSGSAQTLTAKSYYTASQIGLADNSISSIKVPAGYKATVYTDANMKGREVTLTESVKCLPHVLNNDISSIVVSKVSATGNIANNGKMSVYSSCNYKGSVLHFSPADYSDLRKSLNNTSPASLQIPSGLEIKLYSQKNYKGKLLGTYTNNQSCLSKTLQGAKSMKVSKKATVKPQPRKK